MLSEQALEARRAYKRAWAKSNPDKVKAQQERYWQRQAEQAKQGDHISCRGCEYSHNPALYDGGCKLDHCAKEQPQPAEG